MDQSRPNELPKIGNSSLRTFQFALQSNFCYIYTVAMCQEMVVSLTLCH